MYNLLIQSNLIDPAKVVEPLGDHLSCGDIASKFKSQKLLSFKRRDKKYRQTLKTMQEDKAWNSKELCVDKNNVIDSSPFKVLDAPCLRDDYYLNLVDWSKDDFLSVGLDQAVYIWDSVT